MLKTLVRKVQYDLSDPFPSTYDITYKHWSKTEIMAVLSFDDGTDDQVVNSFAQEEMWSAFSISLWVRTDYFAQPLYCGVINNNSSSPDFQIDVDGTDPGNYRYLGSTGQGILGPVTGSWGHFAVSCDGSQTSHHAGHNPQY